MKFSFLILLLLAAVFSGFFWWRWSMTAVDPQSQATKIFVIQKGESLASVATRLQRQDLIKSAPAFRILVLGQGLSGKIQVGDFQLSPSLTSKEVAFLLTHGALDIWLTFPEGWRKEEIGRRLLHNLDDFDYQEFLSLSEKKEGQLFPDTYLLPKQATAAAVLKIFQRNFEKKISASLQAEAQRRGLTLNQVLILASIVEREAKHEQDRPLIAGILIKRWQESWSLQADATLQYAKANQVCYPSGLECNWWPQVGPEDKKIPSPYNTYLYSGLPFAPICNPGLATIEAIIFSQPSDYWYYLSDSQGRVHYAKTIEEHQQNIAEHLR